MSDKTSQSKERYSVLEKSEHDDTINIVLNTDDAQKAKTAFTASTAREILDNKIGKIVGSVEWVQKSGNNRAPQFNLDESFRAVLEGRPELVKVNEPPQPEQNDLFQGVPTENQEEVVHLDFEPEEPGQDLEQEHNIPEGPPLEAYIDDALAHAEQEAEANEQTGSTAPEEHAPVQKEDREPSTDLDEDTKLNLDPAEGRWQVIIRNEENKDFSVLFKTDDQKEALDALNGYETEQGSEIHIYDAANGQRIISKNEIDNEHSEPSKENEKENTQSLESHTENAFSSLDENVMEDEPNLEQELNPQKDTSENKHAHDKNVDWSSLKAKQQKKAINEPEQDDLEDDQIFGAGPSYGGSHGNVPSGGTYQTSTLGAIGSSIVSSARNILNRNRNIPCPTANTSPEEQIYTSKHSFESHFNNADADQWKEKQLGREMDIINAEIKYSIDAIERLACSEYSGLAREIESSGNPTEDQRKKLATLKESNSVTEARKDIESHINNVETRVSRILKDDTHSNEIKKEVQESIKKWSKDIDKSMEGLPNDDFKKDLLTKIKKLIDMIVDRLSPKTSSDPSPSR